MNPVTIKPNDPCYQNLLAVAQILQATSITNSKYIVSDVYYDFGQDWMWTTICRIGHSECQILSPRQWEDIILADSVDDLFKCVNDIRHGKWFGDTCK